MLTFVYSWEGWISHAALLCVNEGFTPLQAFHVHLCVNINALQVTSVFLLGDFWNVSVKIWKISQTFSLCLFFFLNKCRSANSNPWKLRIKERQVFHRGCVLLSEEEKGERGISHKDPPGELMYSPRQAWGSVRIWAWLITPSPSCPPLSPGCEIPGGPKQLRLLPDTQLRTNYEGRCSHNMTTITWQHMTNFQHKNSQTFVV